jgi:acyl-CoA synthetase (AMP-forming)/AMP-acid ligase II
MRIVDADGNTVPVGTPGEIQVRGHNVMNGYWNLPGATQAAIKDGRLCTGDIGRVDRDGFTTSSTAGRTSSAAADTTYTPVRLRRRYASIPTSPRRC